MSLFIAAKSAFELGKRLRGQSLPDPAELLAIAEAWEATFLDAGLDEETVNAAVKSLAQSGESITASAIIKAGKALLPAQTASQSLDTDERDRRYYRSALRWAERTHRCPRMWPDWTEYTEKHARKLGVLREWSKPLVSWETANAFKAWVTPWDFKSDDWEEVNRRFREKLAESQNKQQENDG
ncbi:hypothetical protein [Lawsonella clevelandensis]|uniref:hypothetical protein n=1 Tax=Lawsonella clevelandensis TaxID=1528099 RepID=UPI0027BA439A|nr:hypothetical protein [Lawsonella clevelandensis]